MQVTLFVADTAWFMETPVEFAIIDANIMNAWRTLGRCEKQDGSAWFLLANSLLHLAHESGKRNSLTP
jgi:hypothetical protein